MDPMRPNAATRTLAGVAALTTVAALLFGQAARAGDDATVKLFKAKCASCHGEDGHGRTTAGKKAGVKDWSDGKTLKALSDDEIKRIIREGRKDKDGKWRMKPNKSLSPEQIDGLVKHVRMLQH
jgi:mono/diheme cytochrome c family protein